MAIMVWRLTALMMKRLHQLGLDDGRAHFQDGLIFEKDAAFRQGPDLAGEAQTLQEVQEGRRKEAGGGEISQVVGREAQGFQIVQDFGEPRGHKVAALGRILADEQAEGGLGLHILVEIAGRHGQLVEVGQERRGVHPMVVGPSSPQWGEAGFATPTCPDASGKFFLSYYNSSMVSTILVIFFGKEACQKTLP